MIPFDKLWNARLLSGILLYLFVFIIPIEANRGVWVTRWSFVENTPEQIVRKCIKYKISDIFIQVYAKGYTFYNSKYAPSKMADEKFHKLVSIAHNSNIKIHAWINVYYVWSLTKFPYISNHIINSHIDWITAFKDGKELYRYDSEGIKNLGLEGYFISPANRDANRYIIDIIREIMDKFDVDGIHLDYIRYPGLHYGYDKYTRGYFMEMYGIDPMKYNTPFPIAEKKLNKLFSDWRRDILTDFIDEIYKITKGKNIELSAAVLSSPEYAKRYFLQDWGRWIKEKDLDFVVLMLYTKNNNFFDKRLKEIRYLYNDNNIWIGIGNYLLSDYKLNIQKNKVISNGYRSMVYFSYSSLK
jgi:uncharacterized lipoprotein YddW (UPF0748 family)